MTLLALRIPATKMPCGLLCCFTFGVSMIAVVRMMRIVLLGLGQVVCVCINVPKRTRGCFALWRIAGSPSEFRVETGGWLTVPKAVCAMPNLRGPKNPKSSTFHRRAGLHGKSMQERGESERDRTMFRFLPARASQKISGAQPFAYPEGREEPVVVSHRFAYRLPARAPQ